MISYLISSVSNLHPLPQPRVAPRETPPRETPDGDPRLARFEGRSSAVYPVLAGTLNHPFQKAGRTTYDRAQIRIKTALTIYYSYLTVSGLCQNLEVVRQAAGITHKTGYITQWKLRSMVSHWAELN